MLFFNVNIANESNKQTNNVPSVKDTRIYYTHLSIMGTFTLKHVLL